MKIRKLENRWKTAGKPLETVVELPENRLETAGKPSANPLENRRRTAGKPPAKPLESGCLTAGKPPAKPLENCRETTGKTAGKRASNRWKTVGKTSGKRASNRWKNRWKTAGGPLAKTVGKPPKTAGKSPVFGSLLPVSIRAGNGWEGPLRRHFSALGGGCHKETTFQAQLMYFSKRWGWRNGDLRVFRRDEGHSRSDDAKIGISL